jgi:hypothetical protein
MTNKNKTTDTTIGDTGNAAAKNESTASSKAAARKKQQQLKNQKLIPQRRRSNLKRLSKPNLKALPQVSTL